MFEGLDDLEEASWKLVVQQISFFAVTESLVIALVILLQLFYSTYIKTRAGDGALHLAKTKVLGSKFQLPDDEYLWFSKSLSLVNVLFSGLTVALWILKTQRLDVDSWVIQLEIVTTAFFTLHFLVNLVRSEFSWDYVLSCSGVIDVFTIVVILLEGGVSRHQTDLARQALLNKRATYASHVHLLQGSVFSENDLRRCKFKSCSMFFVLPSMNCSNPDETDERGILMTAAMLKMFPATPFQLVLLRPHSRMLAKRFNIPQVNCFAMYEFKANLLAQGVRCPGLSTILFHLGKAPQDLNISKRLLDAHPWISEYKEGALHQVIATLLRDEYCGVTFLECALKVYEKTRALLIAFSLQGRIVTNPGKAKRVGLTKRGSVDVATGAVTSSTVVYLIAKSKDQVDDTAARVAPLPGEVAPSQSEGVVKHRNSTWDLKLQSASTFSSFTLHNLDDMSGSVNLKSRFTEEDRGRGAELRAKHALQMLVTKVDKQVKVLQAVQALEAAGEKAKERREKAIFPALMMSTRGHIVVLATGKLLEQQIAAFIRPLRSKAILIWREIVVVSKHELPKDMPTFRGVHYINADPMDFHGLALAAVEDAFKIVILDAYRPHSEPHLMDQNTVLCNGVVESYLNQFPQSSASINTVLSNPHSIKQLAQTMHRESHPEELPRFLDMKGFSMSNLEHMGSMFVPKKQLDVLPPSLHPQFVSGESMVLTQMMGWVASEFHTPGFVQLMEALMSPENGDGGMMPSMLWMMHASQLPECSTWDQLATRCMSQGAIPIAAHRSMCIDDLGPSQSEGTGSFVMTNPSPDMLLDETDRVLLLAAPRWAYGQSMAPGIVKSCPHMKGFVVALANDGHVPA
eukprot:gene6293-7544_t